MNMKASKTSQGAEVSCQDGFLIQTRLHKSTRNKSRPDLTFHWIMLVSDVNY